MGLSRTILGAGVLVLLLGCTAEEPDRVIVVSAHGSETNTTSTVGTTVVGVYHGLEVEAPVWTFSGPEDHEGRIPPVRLVAIGDAMFRTGPDDEVLDALRTKRGTVALVRRKDGRLLLCHFEGEESAAAPAPAGARRILAGTREPFTVRLLVSDDIAVTATRIE